MSEQEQTEWLPSGSLPAFQAQQFRTSRRRNYQINAQPALSNTRQQYDPFHLGPPLFGLYPNGLFTIGLLMIGLSPFGLPMMFGLSPFGLF